MMPPEILPASPVDTGTASPSEVPDGWFVVNPRRMKELEEAERAVARVRELADEWASEPYAEEFTSILAGVLVDVLQGGSGA